MIGPRHARNWMDESPVAPPPHGPRWREVVGLLAALALVVGALIAGRVVWL